MGPLSSVNIGACWLSFPSAKRDTALLRCYRSGDGRKQATSVPLYKCERQPRHAFAFAVDCLRASQYAPHALPDTSVKFAVAGVCTLRSWPCRGWLRMLRSHMPGPRLRLQQHRARRGRQLRTPRMANCQAPPVPPAVDAASGANGANDDNQQRLRCCITPQCGKLYLYTRHRHCCSLCRSSGGVAHARRCGALLRALTRGGLIPRQNTAQCSTPGCPRGSGKGYRDCCSYCRYGRHSGRCTSVWQSNMTRGATSCLQPFSVREEAALSDLM